MYLQTDQKGFLTIDQITDNLDREMESTELVREGVGERYGMEMSRNGVT